VPIKAILLVNVMQHWESWGLR